MLVRITLREILDSSSATETGALGALTDQLSIRQILFWEKEENHSLFQITFLLRKIIR